MGDRNLTVKRANSAVQAQQAQAATGAAVPAPVAPAPQLAGAIRVVKLMHAGERAVVPGCLDASFTCALPRVDKVTAEGASLPHR